MTTKTNVTTKIERFEKDVRQLETLKITVDARIGACLQQFNEINDELKEAGVSVENGKEALAEKGRKLKESLAEYEALIPAGLIKELQAELDKPIEVDINLDDDDLEF